MIKLKHLLLEVSLDQLKTQFVDTGKITDSEFIEYKQTDLGSRCRVLFGQIEELRKVDYNVELVYELEGKFKEH